MSFNIWQSIITVVVSVLLAFIDMFPAVNPDTLAQFNGGLAPFKVYLSNAGWLFPVSQFFIIIGIVIALESAFFTIKIAHWVLKNVTVLLK